MREKEREKMKKGESSPIKNFRIRELFLSLSLYPGGRGRSTKEEESTFVLTKLFSFPLPRCKKINFRLLVGKNAHPPNAIAIGSPPSSIPLSALWRLVEEGGENPSPEEGEGVLLPGFT